MIHMKETLTIYTENLHKICVWCCVESLYIRCHVMSNTFPKKKIVTLCSHIQNRKTEFVSEDNLCEKKFSVCRGLKSLIL